MSRKKSKKYRFLTHHHESKSKAHRFWRAIKKRHKLIKDFIIGVVVVVVVVPYITKHDQEAYQKKRDMDSYVQTIRKLAYQDEITFTYCNQWKQGKIDEKEFKQNLALINSERTNKFLELVSAGKTLHKNKQLRGSAYDEVVKLGRYNDQLLDSGMNVCSLNLKNAEELRIWIDDIINKINKQ